MKKLTLFSMMLIISGLVMAQKAEIRINQLGYRSNDIKVAVLISSQEMDIQKFEIRKALTDKVVFTGDKMSRFKNTWGQRCCIRLDFSSLQEKGGYYIQAGNIKSPTFKIADQIYRGTSDFLLKYMRQQRCGFNPFLKDSCHQYDGVIVDHPTRSDEHIDVRGGWHDASDYLQYTTTSANAIYQMLFAYQQNPQVFSDHYDAKGLEGPNGIPDILDEAKWGLDWLNRMNPSHREMYNQIADDRDHKGYRLPNEDSVLYDGSIYRPVYFVTGKPQGLAQHKNNSTGVSSIAGKYTSAFALGSSILAKYYPEFCKKIRKKAIMAYQYGKEKPGYNQTACNVSPYFYEERNWVDDMELAAMELYRITGEENYLEEADFWGNQEAISPWIRDNGARHYESYPFVNLGHYHLAKEQTQRKYINYLQQGLDSLYYRGKTDPFFYGIPFIWCSNNLVAAALTQARLYHQLTKDDKYVEMEAAIRDWLLGCNPWGTSMICGLPQGGDNPEDPHSSFVTILNINTLGGLVDGPVYSSIYESLRGIQLTEEDEYAFWQKGPAVYHDDHGDYSTNEPTMDGTASLSFYFSSLEKSEPFSSDLIDKHGALIRKDSTQKTIYLLFSGGSYAEGGKTIMNALKKRDIKASFFFTGEFYKNQNPLVKKLIKEGHYLGAHSAKHLLYADWNKRDSLLISREEFQKDLRENIRIMDSLGIDMKRQSVFLPPYEWYNRSISQWSKDMGLQLINFTPGIHTNADYTYPGMKSYRSSKSIYEQILEFESSQPSGLNGFLILIHIGTDKRRKDKFYNHLASLLDQLYELGYKFERF